MSATTIFGARGRGADRDWLGERSELVRWALPAVLALAGLNFFWQLGSSSYFIDEAFSVLHSSPDLGSIFHSVAHTETTPYTYFLLLHVWLKLTGSETEWVTRLPSAVAGIGLVWAVYWMAKAFVGPVESLAAAALCALSPLILSYAQETRVYIFLVLALTISVAATVRAGRRMERQTRLLILGAAAAAFAIWLHYTAISVIVPLMVWVATRSTLSPRKRTAFVAACVLAFAVVTPLLLYQYGIFPNGGEIAGAINWDNTVSVIATPFAARLGTPADLRTITGAVVVLCALLALIVWRKEPLRERGLLIALGAVGVVGVFLLDLTGKHILITRYTVVVAPFLITAIAAACFRLPRAAGAALAVAAVAVSIAGLVDDHSESGFYAPVRPAVEYIAARERPSDFMLSPGFPLTDTPIFYYDIRRMRPKLHFLGINDPAQHVVFRRYKRIWIIDNPPKGTLTSALAKVGPVLRKYHYRASDPHVWSTSIALGVMLATPAGTAAGSARTSGGSGRTAATPATPASTAATPASTAATPARTAATQARTAATQARTAATQARTAATPARTAAS